jgi:hypothetical protein
LASVFGGRDTVRDVKLTVTMQFIILMIVLVSSIAGAFFWDLPNIIVSLVNLTFGYYFGSAQSDTPPDRPA